MCDYLCFALLPMTTAFTVFHCLDFGQIRIHGCLFEHAFAFLTTHHFCTFDHPPPGLSTQHGWRPL